MVSRFSFARLEQSDHVYMTQKKKKKDEPVLEPNLHLSRRQARDLLGKPFPMSSIWVCLTSKLAHQEPGLIVREADH